MSELRLTINPRAELRLLPLDDGEGMGLTIELDGQTIARNSNPLVVQVFSSNQFHWHRAPYADSSDLGSKVAARGQIKVRDTLIRFEDVFETVDNHLHLSRAVYVEGSCDRVGFLSAFEWQLVDAAKDDRWFVPGIWYGHNDHVPPYAIGSHEQRARSDSIVFREDRLPLPLLMHYDERRHCAFALLHRAARAETIALDDNDAALIDSRLGFGALGLCHDGATIGFWYPGTEGDALYPPMWTLGVGNPQAASPVNPFRAKSATRTFQGWNNRYHPLQDGIRQHYELCISVQAASSYLAAMRAVWRGAFAEYQPRVRPVKLIEAERTSRALLSKLVVHDNDAIGIPTWIDCFTGKPGRLQNTFGIGFVARNLEAAYLLLQAGHQMGSRELLQSGRDIVDSWVTRGGMGLSHTEYDRSSKEWVDGGGERGSTRVFLRDQSEARRACLRAWELERAFGSEHSDWLNWVKSYGEWLKAHQNPDGSFYRSYDLHGKPTSTATNDGSHTIPFLLDLERAAGESDYAKMALACATYLWNTYHKHGEFIGGTLDNPNCYDKEAAALAMEAYLRLFEATSHRQWLEAAELAAQLCETWIICWEIPMPLDDKEGRFFSGRATTVGFQLITTGFSAIDTYLARYVGDWARLAQWTGDNHYLDVARILLHNTKSTLQMADEYGYALPGFQIEHWSIGRGRGFGLNSGWLPWVTIGHLISINDARKFEDNEHFRFDS